MVCRTTDSRHISREPTIDPPLKSDVPQLHNQRFRNHSNKPTDEADERQNDCHF